MRTSASLWVAIAAAGLLVVVVAVDASVNRTMALDVQDDDGTWQTLASTSDADRVSRLRSDVTIEANRSDDVRFRLRVDNEPPWGFEETYEVRASGRLIDTGTLEVPGGASQLVGFTVPAEELFDTPGPPRDAPETFFATVEVHIGTDALFGSLHVREVPR